MERFHYKYGELMAEDEGLYTTFLIEQAARGAVADGE
jgi:hypothetical protein